MTSTPVRHFARSKFFDMRPKLSCSAAATWHMLFCATRFAGCLKLKQMEAKQTGVGTGLISYMCLVSGYSLKLSRIGSLSQCSCSAPSSGRSQGSLFGDRPWISPGLGPLVFACCDFPCWLVLRGGILGRTAHGVFLEPLSERHRSSIATRKESRGEVALSHPWA